MESKSRAGLVGLGLGYMEGCAIVARRDLWNSSNSLTSFLAFIGGGIVSISGLAIVFYTSSLEEKVRELEKRFETAESEAARWKHQAEKALEQLEWE